MNALNQGMMSGAGLSYKLDVENWVDDVAEPDWMRGIPVFPLKHALASAQLSSTCSRMALN